MNKNNSIEEDMVINLVASKPSVSNHLNKIIEASKHLNNATEILDNLGLHSQASLLKNITAKVAKNKLNKIG